MVGNYINYHKYNIVTFSKITRNQAFFIADKEYHIFLIEL